jgi:hypothetical protein
LARASERVFWYSTIVSVTGPFDSSLDDEHAAREAAPIKPDSSTENDRLARTETPSVRPTPDQHGSQFHGETNP